MRLDDVFARHVGLGAAFAVHVEGELVVDLWGGVADRRTGRPWTADTPVLSYSCTKAVTATVALLLVERGLFELATPVAALWPEFAAQGVTVEHLLTHQAGLPVIEEQVPVEEYGDQAAIAARLARQSPLWEPGSAHGYHALTYGFLIGEVVRRVTGKSVGDLVAAEIAGPLGLDLWLGAPDDVIARAARLSAGPRPDPSRARATTPLVAAAPLSEAEEAARDPYSLMNRALGNPGVHRLKGGANHPDLLRAGWPAMGLVTTARALSGFYRALIAGEILQPDTLRDALRPRAAGRDRVLLVDTSFGLGFMLPSEGFAPFALTAFGHAGMGGFLGLADPARGLALAYTMNEMSAAFAGGTAAWELTKAVYDAL
ncbi:serine hydrolase domain-containing protein [Nonomuraea africana]|uniref:CubicO group peptidase (Beta-lactamase class C family) n=1 Tax=Nonomuraea africana TaxID=46171 RepID=A0ABR9KLH4_9ACTN|nr:serine hydrolase domain-containing protein [Nonomuraea africana]MBE1562646.1 CubicO group peptidase (beta-lactamase class C family) [Nonomuraea africana]